MFKKIFYSEILGALFTIGAGVLLHFTYEWSEENLVVAAFSSVNESNWEHLKLLFIPMLLYAVLEYLFLGRRYNSYILAKTFGILSGIYFILSLVYTYSGIIGRHFVVVDIIIFIISVILAHIISYYFVKNYNFDSVTVRWCSLAILLLFLILFIVFTYYPPQLNLFLDPQTQSYGV